MDHNRAPYSRGRTYIIPSLCIANLSQCVCRRWPWKRLEFIELCWAKKSQMRFFASSFSSSSFLNKHSMRLYATRGSTAPRFEYFFFFTFFTLSYFCFSFLRTLYLFTHVHTAHGAHSHHSWLAIFSHRGTLICSSYSRCCRNDAPRLPTKNWQSRQWCRANAKSIAFSFRWTVTKVDLENFAVPTGSLMSSSPQLAYLSLHSYDAARNPESEEAKTSIFTEKQRNWNDITHYLDVLATHALLVRACVFARARARTKLLTVWCRCCALQGLEIETRFLHSVHFRFPFDIFMITIFAVNRRLAFGRPASSALSKVYYTSILLLYCVFSVSAIIFVCAAPPPINRLSVTTTFRPELTNWPEEQN